MSKKLYHYGMTRRGFSPGAQPKGVVRRYDSQNYYDIIVYDRPLTEDEERYYDLKLTRIEIPEPTR